MPFEIYNSKGEYVGYLNVKTGEIRGGNGKYTRQKAAARAKTTRVQNQIYNQRPTARPSRSERQAIRERLNRTQRNRR